MSINPILIGYMGCGKTSVGEVLALDLDYDFYDLDTLIVEQQSQEIGEIFQQQGETSFRQIEHETLKTFLRSHTGYVLSVGGGTPCHHDHMNLMNKYAKTIYLQTSVSILFKRLRLQKISRPMIVQLSDESLHEFIVEHLPKREIFYEKAYKRINVNDRSVQEVALEIKTWYNQ
ncbi:MAG: shikimate kinase [Flavobacteriales bacterium AspAUS03]